MGLALLAAGRVDRFAHLPTRVLKVDIDEALTGYSYIYHPDGLNTTLLSQG